MRFVSAIVVCLIWLAGAPAEDRTIIEIVKGNQAKAAVGNVVRVKGSIPSGMGEITAEVVGPGKIIATNNVQQQSGGQTLIGMHVKEFEVVAEEKGKITITVTIDNKIQKRKSTRKYTVTVD
jgi:hypothetical protein